MSEPSKEYELGKMHGDLYARAQELEAERDKYKRLFEMRDSQYRTASARWADAARKALYEGKTEELRKRIETAQAIDVSET